MYERKETKRVVFHHSLTDTGSVEKFRDYHVNNNGWEDIGYHYVIPSEGHFQVGRDKKYVGAHASGKNKDSIGVCLIGDFRFYEPTEGQIEECLKLYHELCRYYGKNLIIDFHRKNVNPCPGEKLDRKKFVEIVSMGMI